MTEPADRRPAGQWTPAELGVHPAVGGGPQPAYVPRPHDEQLRAVLDPENQYSRLVVVRGDALAGASRSVYEAVTGVLADWAMADASDPAVLSAWLEAEIPERTVLWLGDLRHHADADGGAVILERLDNVLESNGRAVAIATIWPGYWDSYTAAAATGRGATDPAAVAGRVLAALDVLAEYAPDAHDPAWGGVVDVPAWFTAEELVAAAETGDPALTAAVAAAGPDGQVTLCLAGAADLLARYAGPGADPRGQAIITAAMDAARLGYASPLPAALLRQAAAGYLTGQDHAGQGTDDLWEAALAWATESGWALRPVPPGTGYGAAGYRIVAYLDQHGRRTRGDRLGPASLWDALASHTVGFSDLGRVARAAQDRGLYRHAAELWTAAVAVGRTDAGCQLVAHLRGRAEPDDVARAASWAAGQASLNDPWEVARLVEALRTAEAGDAIELLLARDLAGRVDLEHQWDVAELFRVLRDAGAADAARELVVRVAGQVRLFNPKYLAWLVRALHTAGAAEARHALASRVATGVIAQAVSDVAKLLPALHAAGETDAIQTLGARAAQVVDVEDSDKVAALLTALRAAGADDAIRVLLARDPGAHVSLDQTGGVADLLEALRAAGAADAVRALASRAAAQANLDDGEYTARLLRALRAAGAGDAVQVLLARDPAGRLTQMYPPDLAELLSALHTAGAEAALRALVARIAELPSYYLMGEPELARALRTAGATDVLGALCAQAVAAADIDRTDTVAELLEQLRDAGASDAIQALLDRDPASHADLDDPWDVAQLLQALHAAGADQAMQALAARAARDAPLDDAAGVARLLEALRKNGLDDAARALASRAARGADLADPLGVARLLEELRAAGAADAVRVLVARDPGRHAAFDASQPFRPGQQQAVRRLLAALRAAEAEAPEAAEAAEAVQRLAVRAADAGMFGLFLESYPDRAAAYRFGREPDGTPSPPWAWSEPAAG